MTSRSRATPLSRGVPCRPDYLYAFAFAVYKLAHLCRTPKELDLERDTREIAILGLVSVRDQTIKEREHELAERKKIPSRMDVLPIEIWRIPSNAGRDQDSDGRMAWDIFCLLRVELSEPLSVSMVSYKLTLSTHGAQRSFCYAERFICLGTGAVEPY